MDVDGIAIKSTKMYFSRAFASRSTRNSFLFSIYLEIVIMSPVGRVEMWDRSDVMWWRHLPAANLWQFRLSYRPIGSAGAVGNFSHRKRKRMSEARSSSVLWRHFDCKTFLNQMNKKPNDQWLHGRYWPKAILFDLATASSCALSRHAMRKTNAVNHLENYNTSL